MSAFTSKIMQKLNRSTTFLLLIIFLLISYVIYGKIASRKTGYDSSTVLTQIEKLQELSLVKYNYTGVIGYKDTLKVMNMNVPFTEKYFLIKYNGYIKAGIDLKKSNVQVNGKEVVVYVPKPQIFDAVIDEKSLQIYDQSTNLFNPVSINDYRNAIVKEKNMMIRSAVKQGVLNEARKNAQTLLIGILKEMKFTKIEIKENNAIELPERK